VVKPNNVRELSKKMVVYFRTYDDVGAPSFDKFCAKLGVTKEELMELRGSRRFDTAYRECSDIQRDFLVDRALEKRFDPNFVKFLLSYEKEEKETEGLPGHFSLSIEVSE
jgi:hypothetical protein